MAVVVRSARLAGMNETLCRTCGAYWQCEHLAAEGILIEESGEVTPAQAEWISQRLTATSEAHYIPNTSIPDQFRKHDRLMRELNDA